MSGHQVPAEQIDAEERLFREALAAWQAAGQSARRPRTALFGLGLVCQVLHRDWASAMPYFWQALELVEANEASTGLYLRSECTGTSAFTSSLADEQPAEAVRHLQLSLDLREQLGDPRRIPSGQVALARAELAAGRRDRAVELLRAAVLQARDSRGGRRGLRLSAERVAGRIRPCEPRAAAQSRIARACSWWPGQRGRARVRRG